MTRGTVVLIRSTREQAVSSSMTSTSMSDLPLVGVGFMFLLGMQAEPSQRRSREEHRSSDMQNRLFAFDVSILRQLSGTISTSSNVAFAMSIPMKALDILSFRRSCVDCFIVIKFQNCVNTSFCCSLMAFVNPKLGVRVDDYSSTQVLGAVQCSVLVATDQP